MRYRDQPTVEVTQRVRCDVSTAWGFVSDIALPVHCSAELQSVEWLDGAEGLAVGARFRGRNRNEVMGEWETVSEVAEVEDQRRWVWNVVVDGQISTSWGFEVEPTTDGVLIRQWGRLGPGPSGLRVPIAAQPDKEAQIIERRLAQWRQGMAANLEWIRARVEDEDTQRSWCGPNTGSPQTPH